MSVRDLSTLGLTAVPLYESNAGVAQSAQTATRWRNEHGIPSANALGYDFGNPGVDWTPSEATAYAFCQTIATHCTSVSATGVYVVAGCPVTIGLRQADGTDAGGTPVQVDIVHIVQNAKAIVALGYIPRAVADGTGGYYIVKRGGTTWSNGVPTELEFFEQVSARAEQHPTAIEAYNDVDYDAAITAAGAGYGSGWVNQFIRYQAGFNVADFAGFTRLLSGWVGYYTHEDAGHPTYDQSRIIIGRAAGAEGRLADLTARKVLIACGGTTGTKTDIGKSARYALLGKKFTDLGYAVTYWREGEDLAAEELLPTAGSHANWSMATLNDNSATGTQTFDLALGASWDNVTPSTWADHITPTVNGVFIGGLSGNGKWGKWCQTAGGHSAIVHQVERGGQHVNTVAMVPRQCDAVLALIAGKTLAEAAWLGRGGSLVAIGDPLCRLFQ